MGFHQDRGLQGAGFLVGGIGGIHEDENFGQFEGFFLRWGSGRTSAFPTCHKTWTVVHWWFFGVQFGGDWVFHLDVWEFGGFGIFTGIQAGGEFGASHPL